VETMNKIWSNFSLWSETAIRKRGGRKENRHKETGKGKYVDVEVRSNNRGILQEYLKLKKMPYFRLGCRELGKGSCSTKRP
jgi:hypothetical protein